ncbi:MAG: hypothetical protein AAB089_04415 [Nitrospirota bacterium]
MIFKLRTIILGLIFVFCFFVPILSASEPVVPLPKDALKISERNVVSGPVKSLRKNYESSWDGNKLVEFYKKEMKKAGWVDNGNGSFVKDGYLAVITVSSAKNVKGKTGFTVSTLKTALAREISAMHKENPDKLKFMPVYPGSEQVYLWDNPHGVTALYKAEGSIKEAVFFYKSGMLNYGWVLSSEKPIKGNVTGALVQTNLIFHKAANEICEIEITNSYVAKSKVSSLSKITISVRYNVYNRKKIKR